MAKKKTETENSVHIEAIAKIMSATKSETAQVQGEFTDEPKERDLTESEKIAEIKKYFNANAESENAGELESKIHSVTFNPTEKETEKIAKIKNLLS